MCIRDRLVFESPGYRPVSAQVLQQIYGLTRAEIVLVQALASGPSLEEAAHVIGIAVNTARTHLKHIFIKTGAKRQSELIHQGETGVHLVQDVIRKAASVAAVEEGPNRIRGLASGFANRGNCHRPSRSGVFGHRSPKAPRFVLGGGVLCGGRHRGLRWCRRCSGSMNALFNQEAKRFRGDRAGT